MEPPFFTINACNRCRKRKARCDTGIPACSPCQNSGSTCEYTDPRSKTTYPREFIQVLEDQLASLEREVAELKNQNSVKGNSSEHGDKLPAAVASSGPDSQAHPDLIRLETGGDAHFLGVSSGMHLARSVLESAQRNNANLDSRPHGDSFPSPHSSASQSHIPHRSPHPALPSHETAMNLLDVFFNQYQVQYPILAEEEFATLVSGYYSEIEMGTHRKDPWTKFMLNMAFASTLIFLSQENRDALTLAQEFSSNAMVEFSSIMQIKSLQTLQCLLLLLLYSVLSSSSAPVWYISGLCSRMCVDLGLHSERTIAVSGKGQATEDEIDTKRRLFWVTYTFERTLSIMLGRPFTLEDSAIDVKFPMASLPTNKRSQILHWLKLQRLQSEIVSRLYINRDESLHTQADISKWVTEMNTQLAAWNDQALLLSDSTSFGTDWWRYWYQNALLILHRPSPTISRPDPQTLQTCYGAAKSLIQLSFIRVNRGLTDFTWLELHYQVMSGITLLFLVWNSPDARTAAKNEWITFKSCLVQWGFVLDRLSERWDRMARPKQVLVKLADATVEAVERDFVNSSSRSDEGQRQKRARDQDRRRSIMEQLGSPGFTLGDSGTKRIFDFSQRPRPEDALGMGNSVQEASPTSSNSGLMQNPAFQPFVLSQPPEAPQFSWPVPNEPLQTQPLFDGVDPSMAAEVSAMLAEEVWPSLGPYDNSGVLGGFGLFEYFPMSAAGVDDVEMLGQGMPARVDGVVTDSVLNFRESWENGDGTENNV
ncbi:fungal-specific transcription factor domain-containing protein [Dactylonectria estremocensis]|uniref:Fungal-specific transcription factor domain-containing protein n=1 Tax=Dactylonectria estremocensis TaxID=1079267 RepID=A0A9P9DLU2_9HYPO|nr:fungal-specific transcription factor domain-containing protein [Dactylonectria estremocensis]